MESAQSKVKIDLAYTVYTKVTAIEYKTSRRYISGFGEYAIFEQIALGYYMFMEGSQEAIFLGHSEPDIKTGDTIRVTFQKVEPK